MNDEFDGVWNHILNAEYLSNIEEMYSHIEAEKQCKHVMNKKDEGSNIDGRVHEIFALVTIHIFLTFGIEIARSEMGFVPIK